MSFKRILLSLIGLALLGACSSTRTIKVAVPPRVDLGAYPVVGLVMFSSNADPELTRIGTERFLRAMQAAQPGTRVVELGTESEVLASVGLQKWNAATLRAVGEKHEVDGIVLGRLDVQKSKPDVQLSTAWKQMSVSADVEVTLGARLIETDKGATMWTDSARRTTNLAHASFNDRGEGHVSASDPEAVYGEMIDDLAHEITDDFRVHYVRRRVPREQVETASGRD